MKISCIIPTCDRPKFLVETINSVLIQTRMPLEIIIVNNGIEKISLPQELKEKVLVYDIVPYAGASQARNFGASVAEGDYLAFLDDDDLWSKDYLKNVTKVLGEAQCVISRLDKTFKEKIALFKNAHNKLTIDNLIFYNPGVTGSNIVISRGLFFKVGGYDVKLVTSEDKSLIIEILKKGEKIITLPNNQAIRRTHDEVQLSDPKTIVEGVTQFTKKYKKLMNKKIYLFNLLKICREKIKMGKKIFIFKYLFLKIIYIFLKLFSKK